MNVPNTPPYRRFTRYWWLAAQPNKTLKKSEDTKEVIRIRILKNRQRNGQKKKYKRTNNDLQN